MRIKFDRYDLKGSKMRYLISLKYNDITVYENPFLA